MASQSFPLTPDDGRTAGPKLARILKALRRHRGLRPAQVAQAMGMPLRSYEHFEGGRGQLNAARIARFAEVTDTDAFAILTAIAIDSPEFAVRCADNKLMLALTLEVEAFNAAAGENLSRLSPRTVFAVLRKAFGELETAARGPSAFLEVWREMQEPSDAMAAPDDPANDPQPA